jgi:hypothetical protein
MIEGQATELELLTHHEAGHAAIAQALGFRLRAVGINHLKANGGASLMPGQEPSPYQTIMMLLAGSRAELVLDKDSLGHSTLGVEDEHRIVTILERRFAPRLLQRSPCYVDRLYDRIRQRLAARCEELVRRHWSGIARLAAEIVRWNELTG